MQYGRIRFIVEYVVCHFRISTTIFRVTLTGFVSAVFNCCSDWFILHGEKIRCEKVGMVSTFSQRIIRREFAANFLISTSAHIFRALAAKNSLRTK